MNPSSSAHRRRVASDALAAFGKQRSDHQRLSVQCAHSHHLAAVYATEAGLVYHAVEGPHAHGSKDFVDTAHHGGPRGSEYVDLLDAGPVSDDGLPAWCDCGPHTLSRRDLLEAAADGEVRTVRIP